MLDGRALGASQVEYKPFGKPPLKRESDVKLCQRKPLFPFFRGPLFLGPLVFFFFVFLSPAKVGSLEMQPGAKLQAYLGVSILQPPSQDEVKCWTDEC